LIRARVRLWTTLPSSRYVTAKEWATEGGGRAANSRKSRPFKPLPYYCCGISLQPFETPVSTVPEGTVFDILYTPPPKAPLLSERMRLPSHPPTSSSTSTSSSSPESNIVPYIKKFGKHPITGRPLTAKDLISLTFHKNAQGEYMCPITYKAFTGTIAKLHSR